MTRILIGQLGANGDCLYATIVARQIRHDFPDAHLTWGISSQCVGLIRNNPHIDEVWEVPLPDWKSLALVSRVFEREAVRRLLRREFDHAFLPQLWPSNFQYYDGTVRPSMLRSYGRPITVPIENVIALDAQEQENVERFVATTGLASFTHRILFECSPRSGQSFVTPDLAQDIADRIYALLPSATVIFSTHLPMTLRHANSRHAGILSLREIAGLTHHCSLFVGAGGGGTVAATSSAAIRLPMFQLLAASTSVFASFAHDFKYFGLPYEHIVEMTCESPDRIAAAIACACKESIGIAQSSYGEVIPVRFDNYMEHIRINLLLEERYLDAGQSLLTTVDRYGWSPELREFGMTRIAPHLASDPGWMYPYRRRAGEEFLTRLHQSGTG